MEDDLHFFQHGRRPQTFSKRKTTSIFFQKGRRPNNYVKLKITLTFMLDEYHEFEMEDNLTIFQTGRRHLFSFQNL